MECIIGTEIFEGKNGDICYNILTRGKREQSVGSQILYDDLFHCNKVIRGTRSSRSKIVEAIEVETIIEIIYKNDATSDDFDKLLEKHPGSIIVGAYNNEIGTGEVFNTDYFTSIDAGLFSPYPYARFERFLYTKNLSSNEINRLINNARDYRFQKTILNIHDIQSTLCKLSSVDYAEQFAEFEEYLYNRYFD